MFPREGASSSSTSMSSQRSETDDDRMIAMVLSEEYAKLDGAMAKRLTNLTSIPVRCLMTFMPLLLSSLDSTIGVCFIGVISSFLVQII
jgi:hypothetical protein